MERVDRPRSEEVTLLEFVLRLQGEFRRSLEPLQVTPLQAGVLLFLCRHEDGRATDLSTTLCLKLPTVVAVVNALVDKGWVTRSGSVTDRRAVCLRLSSKGQTLVRKIEAHIRGIGAISRQ